MSRICNLAAMLLVPVALHACGPVHSPQRFVEADRTVDLSVTVPADKAALASGTVYYRFPTLGEADYQAAPMKQRGNELYFSLPTHGLAPGQVVEYYFDVIIDDELHHLAGPTSPYQSTLATHEDVIAHAMSAHSMSSDAGHDVTFELRTGGIDVDHAEVSYYAPHLPGRLTATMDRWGRNFRHVIDADQVRPGYYRYRIHAYVGETVYDLPLPGDGSFRVRKPAD
jgi:hypothetical protein